MLWRAWISLRWLAAWVYTLLVSSLACLTLLIGRPDWGWRLFLKPWAKGTLWLAGIKLNVVGAEHLRGPAVFVSNHQSLLDAVFLPALLPTNIRFVAKKELGAIPFWGWMLKSAAGVMIDRRNPRAAIESIRQAMAKLPPGCSVVVFPEGARSASGELQPFKKGAFHIAMTAGLPIVPIAIEGAHELVPKHAILSRPGTVYVTVGAPLDTRGWTSERVHEYVTRTWLVVAGCLAQSRARRQGAALPGWGGQHVARTQEVVSMDGGYGHSGVDAQSTPV